MRRDIGLNLDRTNERPSGDLREVSEDELALTEGGVQELPPDRLEEGCGTMWYWSFERIHPSGSWIRS
jgi:hypothetical protein